MRGVQVAGQGYLALYFEEDELQGADPHAGLERGRGEGHAQPPAARAVPAAAPLGPGRPPQAAHAARARARPLRLRHRHHSRGARSAVARNRMTSSASSANIYLALFQLLSL